MHEDARRSSTFGAAAAARLILAKRRKDSVAEGQVLSEIRDGNDMARVLHGLAWITNAVLNEFMDEQLVAAKLDALSRSAPPDPDQSTAMAEAAKDAAALIEAVGRNDALAAQILLKHSENLTYLLAQVVQGLTLILPAVPPDALTAAMRQLRNS